MNRLQIGYYLLRYFGPRIALLRASVYWRNWRGTSRHVFQSRPWDSLTPSTLLQPGIAEDWRTYAEWKQSQLPNFLFPLGEPPQVADLDLLPGARRTPDWQARLEQLAAGKCFYFCNYSAPSAINWYQNPFDGTHSNPAPTWCDIPDYLPSQGDPRMLWEPARAGWAFELARSAARGAKVQAQQVYWDWCRSWLEQCPPFHGFHWKCGQESAVRWMALCMGFWATTQRSAPDHNVEKWRDFVRLSWATAYRIQHHIEYAISQKNNHAISEAAGLMVISHLFPEFKESAQWHALGRKVLIQELRRQIYADGSYVQHSMNYHRVMLHGAILAARIGELQQQPLPPDVLTKLGVSVEFLHQMLDPFSGEVPQYGNNDGAYVMPWSDSPFWDFRPVCQAGYFLVHRQRLLPPGPWDEDGRWLFGQEFITSTATGSASDRSLSARSPRVPELGSRAFEDGGYYTLRRDQSWCLMRCHTFRDRPAHYDQLHVDLWWRGLNVLRDCGTHRYYMPDRPDLEKYFKSIRAHNTLELDGASPVESVSRFLWLPWPRGTVTRYMPQEPLPYVEGIHFDYERKPWRARVRRTLIALTDQAWLVVDDVILRDTPAQPTTVRQRWQLADLDWSVATGPRGLWSASTPHGPVSLQVVASDPHTAENWQQQLMRGCDTVGQVEGFASPSYGRREPIPVLVSTYQVHASHRVLTLVALGENVDLEAMSDDTSDGQVSGVELWRVRTTATAFTLALDGPAAPQVAPRRIDR